ncbi:MAG TPA: helix-turn-helix transcriptional regulator [Conexibacter sp.]|jgi:DNA-binding CsgD family transcriptional regulator
MVSATRATVEREAIARVARSGLDVMELLHEVALRLGSVVPYDIIGLLLFDPESVLPTRREVLGDYPVLVKDLLHNEIVSPDVLKFDELATFRRPAVSISSLGARGLESERRTQILGPAGLGDELRVIFRHDGSAWGGACLGRASGALFEDAEIAFVRDIAGVVARGLQRSLSKRTGERASSAASPGVVLLDQALEVTSTTVPGQRWLRLMPAGSEVALQALALRARGTANEERLRRGRIRLTTGEWVTARAAPIGNGSGEGLTSITLAPTEGSEMAQMMLSLHGLTARESDVAALLLTGITYESTARRLLISRHTLHDHVRSIFGKVGVNNRAELMAVLSSGQPAVERRGRFVGGAASWS